MKIPVVNNKGSSSNLFFFQRKVYFIARHPIIIGSTSIFFGAFLSNVFNFLFNLFMSRNLSFADYGVLASISSLMTLFALPVGAVVPMLVYFSASYFARGDLSMVRGLYKKITTSAFFIGFAILAVFFVFRNQIASFFQLSDSSYVVLIGLSSLLSFVGIANQPLLQAKMAFFFLSILNSLSTFLKLIFGIFFVLIGYSVGGVLWGLFISSILTYVISFIPLNFLFSRGTITPKISLKKMFFYGAPAAFATFGLTSLLTVDIVLVKHFFTPEEAGTYAVISLIGRVIYYVSAPITSVMFPLIVQKHTKGEDYNSDLKFSFFLVLLPSVCLVIFYILFPGFVVSIFSPKPLPQSIIPLIIPFGIFTGVYGLLSILTNFFLSINKVKIFIPIMLGSIAQASLIFIFHNTFLQIIIISLFIAVLLLIILLLYYWRLYGKNGKK